MAAAVPSWGNARNRGSGRTGAALSTLGPRRSPRNRARARSSTRRWQPEIQDRHGRLAVRAQDPELEQAGIWEDASTGIAAPSMPARQGHHTRGGPLSAARMDGVLAPGSLGSGTTLRTSGYRAISSDARYIASPHRTDKTRGEHSARHPPALSTDRCCRPRGARRGCSCAPPRAAARAPCRGTPRARARARP